MTVDHSPLKIGIFGGTFNPVHLGHLILAETAREELTLDRVCFMPTRQPPHKTAKDLLPGPVRVQLLQLAIYTALVSLPLLLFLAIRLVRPLEQLAAAARRYPAQPLAGTVLLERRDELGDLARALTAMASVNTSNASTCRLKFIATCPPFCFVHPLECIRLARSPLALTKVEAPILFANSRNS